MTQNECACVRVHEVESHIEANQRLGVGLTCGHVTYGPVLVKVTGAGFVNVDAHQQLVRHPANQCSSKIWLAVYCGQELNIVLD